MADTKISGLSAVTDVLATDEFVLARSSTTKKIDASDLATFLGQGSDGWYLSSDTWTYASATTFTVTGDLTTTFTKGTRLKLTQTTVKYFVVTGSSHAAGTTTVTVTGGTDYTLVSAAITTTYYSYAANPRGYPGWFSYTPSFTGFSANPSISRATFNIIGSLCHVHVNMSAGTSNATTFTFTVPVATRDVTGVINVCLANGRDNGTDLATPVLARLVRNSTTVDVFKDSSLAAFTASSTKGMYLVTFTYEI